MSAIQPSERPGFRVTGRFVLFAVVGFFAVIIGLDAIFMTLAIRSFPGQVSETPFEDGLAFNRTIARREAQARLGYSSVVEAAPGAVVVRLARRDGEPLAGASVAGALTRPATSAGASELVFVERSPGVYSAPFKGAGAWDLSLSVEDSRGRPWETKRRLTWSH